MLPECLEEQQKSVPFFGTLFLYIVLVLRQPPKGLLTV